MSVLAWLNPTLKPSIHLITDKICHLQTLEGKLISLHCATVCTPHIVCWTDFEFSVIPEFVLLLLWLLLYPCFIIFKQISLESHPKWGVVLVCLCWHKSLLIYKTFLFLMGNKNFFNLRQITVKTCLEYKLTRITPLFLLIVNQCTFSFLHQYESSSPVSYEILVMRPQPDNDKYINCSWWGWACLLTA